MIERSRLGFTLVELMIVIGIIAVLAAILVPNYARARQEAQLQTCKQNLAAIGTAWEAYATRHKPNISSSSHSSLDINMLVENGFLGKVPECPAGGTYSMVYHSMGSGVPFCYCYCGGDVHGLGNMAPNWSEPYGLVESPPSSWSQHGH